MSLRNALSLTLLASVSFVPAQNLADYYVNGITGRDVPGGGSPSMPWKTITYAITQIPPIIQPTEWNTLYVEGDQVYSASTNGDALPIRPAYNLWIEGSFVGHGRMPILRPAAGGISVLYDPAIVYQRNPSTLRYLVFEGGAYGVSMGNSAGQRHRPRIQDCTFRGQSQAGARVTDAGPSRGNDPRFFQSLFTDAPRGIEIATTTSGAVVFPDVEECTFTGLRDAAIHLDDNSTGGNVGGLFRSNWFRSCARGVHVRAGASATTTNFEVYSCSFTDIANEGVFFDLVRPPDPAARIEMCSFLRCGHGVALVGALAAGSYSLHMHNNVASACRNNGLHVDLSGVGTCSIDTADNLFERCNVGVSLLARSGVQLNFQSVRDRALRNNTGMRLQGSSLPSSITVQSAMICGNTARGLTLLGSAPILAQSLTVADNATGVDSGATAATLTHCILDGNAINVTGSPTITYSSFQGSSYPGVGNLNFTDPQLIRPLYKLSLGSLCIDRGNLSTPLPATDYEGDPRASVSRPNGSALPDLGADEYMQRGSAHKYGLRGFGYYNFFPEISSSNTQVVIGSTLNVDLSGAILPVFGVPARDAFLSLGLRDDSAGLPFDLTVVGAPGSLLWNEVNLVVGLFPVTPQGTASVPLGIPPLTLFVGQTLTFQWFANQRSANPFGPVASDGLRVTIGQ